MSGSRSSRRAVASPMPLEAPGIRATGMCALDQRTLERCAQTRCAPAGVCRSLDPQPRAAAVDLDGGDLVVEVRAGLDLPGNRRLFDTGRPGDRPRQPGHQPREPDPRLALLLARQRV